MNEPNPSAIPVTPPGTLPRLDSLDLLRGMIMILMALDHVRDFFSHDALFFEPTDLTKTDGALFLTRWITHFCAPIFFFLAGTGAFLSQARGKSKRDLAWFLITRGLWLVFLELTVVRCLGWMFNFNYHVWLALVIWALGWSMVVLAGLIFLPRWAILAVAIAMIGGHNLLDSIRPETFGGFAWLWKILHVPGDVAVASGIKLEVGYPLIPWIGVMAAGYLFGELVRSQRPVRRKQILSLGIALTVAFVVLRAINIYGDPQTWSAQSSVLFTLFSFLNCEKYPPSLLYLLMTLGPAIAFLGLIDGKPLPSFRPVIVFGRVPLFYYLLHIPLIHGLAVAFSYAKYGRADYLLVVPPAFGGSIYPPDYGYGLAGVYSIWLLVIFLLYPACRWFADLKQKRRDVWLSYL